MHGFMRMRIAHVQHGRVGHIVSANIWQVLTSEVAKV